jgi:hypothetical protein
MIDELMDSKVQGSLSTWEYEFVADMDDWRDLGREFTDAQAEKIEEIWLERVDR